MVVDLYAFADESAFHPPFSIDSVAGHGAWNWTESTMGAAASTTLSKRDSGATIAIARSRIDKPAGTLKS